jgi:hypothetical protein
VHAKRLHLEVGSVSRNGEDAERVRVTETALPALHGDDCSACLDDVELERIAQAETDTVVNLPVVYRSVTAPVVCD